MPRKRVARRLKRARFLVALSGRTVQPWGSQRTRGTRCPDPVRGGSDVKTLLLLALAAVVGAVVLSNQDDIRRYMKMRNM